MGLKSKTPDIEVGDRVSPSPFFGGDKVVPIGKVVAVRRHPHGGQVATVEWPKGVKFAAYPHWLTSNLVRVP